MERVFTAVILLLIISTMPIYGQDKETAQVEPVPVYEQIEEIKVELVWEVEIPEGVSDLVLLDDDGYSIFSAQCGNPEKALAKKRILMVHDGMLRHLEGDALSLVWEVPLKGSNITISKNGRNIATIDGLEPHRSGKGGFEDKPAKLRLYNWKGEELASTHISPKHWQYIDLYPLGNDNMVAVSMAGGDGLYHGVKIFVRKGNNLMEVFSNENVSWLADYAENGERALLGLENREMGLFNGFGEEDVRYICPRPYRKAFLSPRGNYVAEVTAGKHIVIFDRDGKLINEHKVQGQGDYYAVFSPDEKYLLATPGFRRIYLFETRTGNLVWEYEHSDDRQSLLPGCVAPDGYLSLVFVALSKQEEKWIWIMGQEAQMVGRIGPLDFVGYTLPIRYFPKTQNVFVKSPSKLLLYHIAEGGGER